MTEFEKWIKYPNMTLTKRESELYYLGAMRAWKAALRWTKAIHDVNSEPAFSVKIKNELNQLNQGNSQSNNSPQSDSPG